MRRLTAGIFVSIALTLSTGAALGAPKGIAELTAHIQTSSLQEASMQGAAVIESSIPYLTDTDGDGKVDALDACPTFGFVSTPTTRVSPECYLGSDNSPGPAWLEAKYRHKPGKDAGWGDAWTSCTPVLAYRVRDHGADGKDHNGFVIVGVSPSANTSALDAVKAAGGHNWPTTLDAQCLLSVDYEGGNTFFWNSPGLATFYARWTAPASFGAYTPEEGLGLVKAFEPAVSTRSTTTPIQRLLFSRAAAYAPKLDVQLTELLPTFVCTEATSGTPLSNFCDPTTGKCAGKSGPTCKLQNTVTMTPMPGEWRVLPTGLDAVLQADRAALKAATGSADLLAGLPKVGVDDRWWRASPNPLPLPVSVGAGVAFPPASFKGVNLGTDPWRLLPPELAYPKQHRPLQPEAYPDWSVTPQQPTGAYVKTDDVVLLMQQVRIGPAKGNVERTFEARVKYSPASPVKTAVLSHSVSSWSPWYGHRWQTNAAPKDCFKVSYTTGVDNVVPYVSNGASEGFAGAWCPGALEDWAYSKTDVSLDPASTCASFLAAQQEGPTIIAKALTHPETLGCAAWKTVVQVAKTGGCCACAAGAAVTCGVAEGAVDLFSGKLPTSSGADCCEAIGCSGCFSEAIKVLDDNADCVLRGVMKQLGGALKDGEHWAATGTPAHPLVPMVGVIRRDGVAPSMDSHMTTQDDVIGGDHQGNDWNFVFHDFNAFDPAYRALGARHPDETEHELEFQVATGKWADNPRPVGTVVYHDGNTPTAYMPGGSKDRDDVGQIFPSDHCNLWGINRDPHDRQDEPTWPTCGGRTTWPPHFGRGIFTPIGAPVTMMEASPNPLQIPFEPGYAPHRIGFLGQPIIDCGHPPFRNEIHPPHVVLLEGADVSQGKLLAREHVAFGWVNITIPGTLEFDLWPPTRPHPKATLITQGQTKELDHIPGGQTTGEWGYVIDNSGPQAGAVKPTLTCSASPTPVPNHLHCVYKDLAGGPRDPALPDPNFRNKRMTPYYATSRFEARFVVGWLLPQ